MTDRDDALLPKLPEPCKQVAVAGYHDGALKDALEDYYTADQMREYAIEALAAPGEGGQGEIVDLGEVIREKVREHGSYRAASKVIGVNYPHLCQMAHDPNRKPSKEILAALGLERVTVTRRLIDSAGGAKGCVR